MEQLGIEPTLLLAQVVNFFIVIFVLSKLLYKPVLSMLEKRKHEIEQGLALTEKMRVEEEKMTVKRSALVADARKEARAILDEAKAKAKDEVKSILAQAHEEAQEIVAKGKVDASRQLADMEKSVRAQSIDLASAMATRLLSKVISDGDQHKLIARHLKELEQVS